MSILSARDAILAEWPSCYMCDEKKTSREHVPPLCFFPDEKDEKANSIYRTNLITVPACDKHNSVKSGDDVYAVVHLAGTIRGNHCAGLLRKGVIERTLKRDQEKRQGRFTKRIVKQFRGVVGDNLYGMVDEKLKILKLPLRVANLDYDLGDKTKAASLSVMRESFDKEMQGSVYQGTNPDVFRYAICEKPDKDVVMIHMIFFGELHRWAFYHPGAERQIY